MGLLALRKFFSSPKNSSKLLLFELRKCHRRLHSSLDDLEKLKTAGFNQTEAQELIEGIDLELNKLVEEFAGGDDLKKLSDNLDEKMSSVISFVISTSPFQMNFIPTKNLSSSTTTTTTTTTSTSTSTSTIASNSNTTSANTSTGLAIINPFPAMTDPKILEKEIKTTAQQLTDEIKQLQADCQLEANLEAKRREEVDALMEEKLETASEYVKERVKLLNDHLNQVSRQVLTAIGGKRIFIT